VFENRVLRRIFGPKKDEVTREWRTLHNEELHDLYCSPNNIRVIKSIRMRWAGNVTRIRDRRGAYSVFMGRSEERDQLEDLHVDGRIILNWFFRKWIWGMDWTDLAQDRDRWRALVNAVMNLRVP
jgi:hypothetical protein